jgi:hypothetical protein
MGAATAEGAVGGEGGGALGLVDGGGIRTCGVEQPIKIPTMQTHELRRKRDMGLILLEALGAGAILVLIVWWTMFSGRDKGEPRDRDPD